MRPAKEEFLFSSQWVFFSPSPVSHTFLARGLREFNLNRSFDAFLRTVPTNTEVFLCGL